MHRYQQFLNVWRIDCRPTPYFQRSVGVCIVGVSTSHAKKFRLAFTVSLIDISALPAGARGVSRVNEFYRDTRDLCFVHHKALQLIKGPTVQTTALSFTSPYPDPNTAKILQSDPASGALCSTNYLLRNYVIHVTSEPLLFALTSAHQALCGFRTLLLKFASKTNVSSPVVVDRRSGESLAIRRMRNRHETEIDPNPLDCLVLPHVRNVNGRKQKPFFVPVNQISLATLKREKLFMMVSADERDLLATVQRPDAREAFVHVPGQDSQVVADRTVFTKLAANLSVQLVSVRNLGVQSHNNLSGQRKLISNRPVEAFVQAVVAKLFSRPREFAQAVTRIIGRFKRAQQSVRLFGRGHKFDLSGELDISPLFPFLTECNQKTKKRKAGDPLL
jgi:hypothetical protein